MQPTTINLMAPSSVARDIATVVLFVALGITVLVHLMVASGVMEDALETQRRGRRLVFFGPLGWTFLSLMTGLLGLVAYWLIHHSTLGASAGQGSTAAAKDDAGGMG